MLSFNHLNRLLKSGEYKRCLEEAHALLSCGDHGPEATARIQAAVCRSHLQLLDHFAAAEAGATAVRQAEEAGAPDLLAQVLVDTGAALCRLRQYDGALQALQRFLDGLPGYTSAQCLEGAALQRMGETYHRAGRTEEAITTYQRARRWFERFGDDLGAVDTARALIHVHLDRDDPAQAAPLLWECRRYTLTRPDQREFLSHHLVDLARFLLVIGRYAESAQAAFQALEAADDRLAQQSRAYLTLCQTALAQHKPVEALSFAMAARVAAIDGKLYDLEFEASDHVFRLLREQGMPVVHELEAEFAAARVDMYHYVSEQALRGLLNTP